MISLRETQVKNQLYENVVTHSRLYVLISLLFPLVHIAFFIRKKTSTFDNITYLNEQEMIE